MRRQSSRNFLQIDTPDRNACDVYARCGPPPPPPALQCGLLTARFRLMANLTWIYNAQTELTASGETLGVGVDVVANVNEYFVRGPGDYMSLWLRPEATVTPTAFRVYDDTTNALIFETDSIEEVEPGVYAADAPGVVLAEGVAYRFEVCELAVSEGD